MHVTEALRQLERATRILKTGTLPPPSAEAGLAELAQAREHLGKLAFFGTGSGAKSKQKFKWIQELADVMRAIEEGKSGAEV